MDFALDFDSVLNYLDSPEIINIPSKPLITGISTDTRKINPGEVFFALKGERYDGHSFLNEAIERGASFCIVEKDWLKNQGDLKIPLLAVSDTLYSLGEIANLYRRQFEIPIIAVAGSNGKTTTKDFIAHLLSYKYNVLKTEGNFNNQIGVPLTLFNLSKNYQIAVIELGTNTPGEIHRLCEIAEPTDGIVTNIGKEHLEYFIDLDGVELEETSLFGYLMKHNGFIFINSDDPRLARYSKIIENCMTFGQNETAQLRAKIEFDRELFPKVEFVYDEIKFSVKLRNRGLAVAYASLPAVAVGLKYGLAVDDLVNALSSFELHSTTSAGRMLIENYKNVLIINDTYNSNPSSMLLALETLSKISVPRKKIAVLGDMLELGESSHQEHINAILNALEVCNKVFVYGERMLEAFQSINSEKHRLIHFENKFDIVDALLDLAENETVVLFKDSRGMKCEEVLQRFVKLL
ncbi:MAG: UDP-N-acetylmuramoyl-tripeptide--D-alanyl-D-alanine ligase [Ignavibacteria bacterium]|nr:UDP-N-acetylmuramoyl-tripeptide--D-alanyl-D-alanine ligase [Ignavibacteria bacterium]